MVDRIRWDTVSYLPFYYVFFQFLLLTIFNLQANILTTKDILSNLVPFDARHFLPARAIQRRSRVRRRSHVTPRRTSSCAHKLLRAALPRSQPFSLPMLWTGTAIIDWPSDPTTGHANIIGITQDNLFANIIGASQENLFD